MSSRFIQIHTERNNQTQGAWDSYHAHRERTTQIALPSNDLAPHSESSSQALTILGYGNGNDVDLSRLAAAYTRVTLVDLDATAMEPSINKLPSDAREKIQCYAPFDFSGVLSKFADQSDPVDAPNVEQLDLAINGSDHLQLPKSDRVISTCLLSQILDSIRMGVPETHPDHFRLQLSVRDAHLRRLIDLTNPGGVATLVTDFVSSETLPSLLTADDESLQQILVSAINDRNFFTGLNPAVLQQKLSPAADGRIASLRNDGVWRWRVGARCYAVTSFSMLRRSS